MPPTVQILSPTDSAPASIPALLEQGLQAHRSGQITLAQAAYRRLLNLEPAHARTLYLLGMTHAQQGAFDAAIRSFQSALTAQPDFFDALYNLGCAYTEAGQAFLAVQTLRRAVLLQPQHAGAWYAMGNALRECGQIAEAIASFREAVRLQPQHVAAHNNLGNAQAEQGEYAQAVKSLRYAAALAPGEWPIHSSLGAALHADGQLDEAATACRRAVSLQPDNIRLYANLAKSLWVSGQADEARRSLDRAAARLKTNVQRAVSADALLTLGGAYQALCEFAEAENFYRQALTIAPDSSEARDRLGQIRWTIGDIHEAETCFRAALKSNPDGVQTRVRLSHTLSAFNRMDEAETITRQALVLQPDDPDARRCLGQLLLKRGDYAQGWPHYDHIHRIDISAPRHFSQPRWDGSDLNGKTILIHAQFGLGDTLQCVRYLPLVQARGGRVLFECPWELAALLERSAGFDEMLIRTPASGNRIPDVPFDVQFNLMSLPALFRSDDATIPADFPYIHVDAAQGEAWRAQVEECRGANNLAVGIVWAASTEGLRSCRALDFAPLADLSGISLISLQKGLEARQVSDLPAEMHIHDLAPAIRDFADTAAIVSHLDLVVTVDTSVAHLAGAMNVPVWTLLPYGADWRWQMDRPDTPWYASMRLLRQSRPGDWSSAISQVLFEMQSRPTMPTNLLPRSPRSA